LRTIILLLTIAILCSHANAKDYGTVMAEKVTSVYDGDTFRIDIKGYPDIIGKNIPIRVNQIDTPEIRGKCEQEKQLAIKAREFTKLFLTKGSIELRNIKRGKYFRVAADVYVNNVSLGDSLIKAKLAYTYNKKKKKSWCKLSTQ